MVNSDSVGANRANTLFPSALGGLINALQETPQPLEIARAIRIKVVLEAINNGVTLSQIMQNIIISQLEKYIIGHVLQSTNGNKFDAAYFLKISRKTLSRKFKNIRYSVLLIFSVKKHKILSKAYDLFLSERSPRN